MERTELTFRLLRLERGWRLRLASGLVTLLLDSGSLAWVLGLVRPRVGVSAAALNTKVALLSDTPTGAS